MRIVSVEFSGKGAMAHYTFHVCRALADQGLDVTLLTSNTYELGHLPHNFKVIQLFPMWDPHRNPTRNRLLHNARRITRGARFVMAWGRVLGFLYQTKPDIALFGIIRFTFERHFLKILKMLNFTLAEVVHDVRMFDHSPGAKSVTKESDNYVETYRNIYKLFDVIFVHDRSNYELFLDMYKVPVEKVIEIPLPPSDMLAELTPDRTAKELKREMNVPDGVPVVLFFGTIAKYKGIELLVEAFPTIHKATNAHLIVAGYAAKDSQPDKLMQRAKELGIENNVSWLLDYFPNERVRPLMEVADVVVYPYRHITQSGALKVAYLFGNPVVATNVGGLPDVVEPGKTGYLIPPENPAAIAEATIKVLQDPQHAKEMGEYAASLIQTKYSWRILAERMKRAFEQLKSATHKVLPMIQPDHQA
jgi:glycosyltransferase involved in cell wall biosynthesis